MSGTFRLAGLLIGIVLALALVGPAVLADTDPNQTAHNEGTLTAGSLDQTQRAANDQANTNNASNFGNNNDPSARAGAASGAVTVWGPKLVLKKTNSQTANASANGNNTGGNQTQLNAANGGQNTGDLSANGGGANTSQGALGGDTTANNYVGAHGDGATATSNTNGASSGNTGNATGGAGGAANANGGGAGAGADSSRQTDNSCNVGAADATTNGDASGTPSANANGGAATGNGSTGAGGDIKGNTVKNPADASVEDNNPDCNGKQNSEAIAKANGGDADGGNGGRATTGDSKAYGDTFGTAANVNAAIGGDTKAYGGEITNTSRGNEGGNATQKGSQKANGGYVKDNKQTETVGNQGGFAVNYDTATLDADITVDATSGNAQNDGNAIAKTSADNEQNAKNINELEQELKGELETNQELTLRITAN